MPGSRRRGDARPRRRTRRKPRLSAASLLRPLASFLLPDSCVCCGAALAPGERHLCGRCRRAIAPALRAIALPPDDLPDITASDERRAFYALAFEGPSRALIHALKYGRRTGTAPALIELAAPALDELPLDGVDLIVPIPLHHVRRRERGFNQAALLAAALSERTGLGVARGLVRTRPTIDQTRLPRDGRLANVRGAFAGVPGAVRGARTLLIDDVATTGATLGEGASALAKTGARSVLPLALAGQGGSNPVARRHAGTVRDSGPAGAESG